MNTKFWFRFQLFTFDLLFKQNPGEGVRRNLHKAIEKIVQITVPRQIRYCVVDRIICQVVGEPKQANNTLHMHNDMWTILNMHIAYMQSKLFVEPYMLSR